MNRTLALQGRPVNVKHDARCVMGNVGERQNQSAEQSAERRLGADSGMQYRCLQTGLLQRSAVWRACGDFRRPAASAEQPGQGRLPA